MARDLDVPTKTCRWHRCRRSYLEWHGWAEAQTKAGKKQRKCPDCGRWFFKEEWGQGPRGRVWGRANPETKVVVKRLTSCVCGHAWVRHTIAKGPKNLKMENLDHCMGTRHKVCGCLRYVTRKKGR